MNNSTDTIYSLITAPAKAAVGIIRLSGPDALKTVSGFFSRPGKIEHSKAVYGEITDAGRLIDTCILTYFRSPNSYTGEDVVELSCHGSPAVIASVISLLSGAGLRQADPGEFTKRAFLNGKTDLTRAEAVAEIIDARSGYELKAARAHLGGSTFRDIEDIRSSLLDIAATLSAYVDYPDEEIEEISREQITETLKSAAGKTDALYEKTRVSGVVKDGISTAITGKTNAGKSSLMNALSGYERSIVTDEEGTTRDVVENTIEIDGIKLILSDTAGLRKTENKAEKLGIEKSIEQARNSSLCLCVFDLSKPLSEEDFNLINLTEGENRIAVLNKCDLESKIDPEAITGKFENYVYVSARTGEGIENLRNIIREKFLSDLPSDGNIIINSRQQSELSEMKRELASAINALESGITLDAVGVCIDGAIDAAGRLTGASVTEDTVNRIFEKFCVGK